MRVTFTELPKKELDDAVAYYEAEYYGFGLKFKEETKLSIDRITDHPKVVYRAW